jgi:hypothetical protein
LAGADEVITTTGGSSDLSDDDLADTRFGRTDGRAEPDPDGDIDDWDYDDDGEDDDGEDERGRL